MSPAKETKKMSPATNETKEVVSWLYPFDNHPESVCDRFQALWGLKNGNFICLFGNNYPCTVLLYLAVWHRKGIGIKIRFVIVKEEIELRILSYWTFTGSEYSAQELCFKNVHFGAVWRADNWKYDCIYLWECADGKELIGECLWTV